MSEVVGGLQKVESLITVLNWIEQSRDQVGSQEHIKRVDGFYREKAWFSRGPVSTCLCTTPLRTPRPKLGSLRPTIFGHAKPQDGQIPLAGRPWEASCLVWRRRDTTTETRRAAVDGVE